MTTGLTLRAEGQAATDAAALARSDGREFTPSPALIGSRFGHARKAGLITRTDWAPSQRRSRRGSENRVWVGVAS